MIKFEDYEIQGVGVSMDEGANLTILVSFWHEREQFRIKILDLKCGDLTFCGKSDELLFQEMLFRINWFLSENQTVKEIEQMIKSNKEFCIDILKAKLEKVMGQIKEMEFVTKVNEFIK